MKRILAVIIAVLLTAAILPAQTFNRVGGGVGTDIYRISTWSAFSSDSSATVYSNLVDVANFDSVRCFVKSTSVLGAPHFTGTLQIGFLNSSTAANWDDAGTAIDTTNSKTETLQYVATLPTQGVSWARLKLAGVNATSTENHTDDIIDIWLVGVKRSVLVNAPR